MHSAFLSAALDASIAPDGMNGPNGLGKRFDVYRNNIIVGLIDALASGFPAVHRIVGDDFFCAMAGHYVRIHPPKSPIMAQYGQDMPTFLRRFPPVKHLPYLPEVAQIELAVRRAYHAADSGSDIDMGALTDLNAISVRLAPAVQTVRCDYPAVDIWHRNTTEPDRQIANSAQSALITRPHFDPVVDPISADQTEILRKLQNGDQLGLIMATHPIGLPELLTLLISRQSITGLCHV